MFFLLMPQNVRYLWTEKIVGDCLLQEHSVIVDKVLFPPCIPESLSVHIHEDHKVVGSDGVLNAGKCPYH